MENKINIAELLRNCPTGMELDCSVFNDVTLYKIDTDIENEFPIRIKTKNDYFLDLTKYGTYSDVEEAKCVIFPKGKTTWEGFTPPCQFKDGDVVISTSNNIHLISCHDKNNGWESCCGIIYGKFDSTKTAHVIPARFATEEEKQKLFDAIRENGYHWNAESKTLENWTIQDAKDGDVISYGDGWTCIFKCIHGVWYSSYCFITSDGEFHTGYEEHEVHTTINGNVHLATKEQCNRLFQKIKEAGYKWNLETKTLEKLKHKFKVGDRVKHVSAHILGIVLKVGDKGYYMDLPKNGGVRYISFALEKDYELVPNKFDINTLVPFEDKVLVRNDESQRWLPAFWGYKVVDGFITTFGWCKYCIPYKGNEILFKTNNDCDDYFKTWENEKDDNSIQCD